MSELNSEFSVKIENTSRHCPIGETTGKQMMENGRIPVISCEGSCIRGETAKVVLKNVLDALENGRATACNGDANEGSSCSIQQGSCCCSG